MFAKNKEQAELLLAQNIEIAVKKGWPPTMPPVASPKTATSMERGMVMAAIASEMET